MRTSLNSQTLPPLQLGIIMTSLHIAIIPIFFFYIIKKKIPKKTKTGKKIKIHYGKKGQENFITGCP